VAHVGRDYPVHLRRDLNLNCFNNRNGLPRAWSCTFDNKGGSIGLALNGKTMFCHAQDESTFEFAKWIGDYETHASRNVRLEVFLTSTQGEVGKGPWLYIRDKVYGNIAVYKSFVANLTAYGEIAMQWDETFRPHPELWVDAVTQRVTPTAVRWTEYHRIYG